MNSYALVMKPSIDDMIFLRRFKYYILIPYHLQFALRSQGHKTIIDSFDMSNPDCDKMIIERIKSLHQNRLKKRLRREKKFIGEIERLLGEAS